ncbi:bestrophin family protein [Marinomonas lutimaris]|uniref:bestrophin family protein n=1 Tax=Marinomonas lutimaris TaxID=2846746 RepID=UPI001CA56CC1|nr:bestrophin family protein [Marinomonas lutimaris]
MIVRPNPNWIVILTTLKGSIAKRIALRVLLITVFASLIVLLEKTYPESFENVSSIPFTLLGLSLSIFMSFRNSSCYDRWWEGRKMWGKIIIDDKLTFIDNPADTILSKIGEKCSKLASAGVISEWRYLELERRLIGLSEAQANCERIKNTPLPFPYTLLLHRTTFVFCLLLPFAMAEPLGWLAPIFTTIVSYTFFGLDAIGNELEDPFGNDVNDLPTDSMVRIIERDAHRALGKIDLPPQIKPNDHVLS